MMGQNALELVKELDRNPDTLPPYRTDIVRRVTEEIRTVCDENTKDVQKHQQLANRELAREGVTSRVAYRHAGIERNTRCLMAYHYNRLERLKRYRWDTGSVLQGNMRANVSEKENRWFQDYNRTLAAYMRSLGDHGGLDLTENRQPPKALYTQVCCVMDYGEFETHDGTVINLQKDSLHSLRRSDCEYLIRQGYLTPVNR